ncbi:MAG: Sec-independent protein translocase subunit TatA/TatB [Actinomycetota bacterium]
MDLGWPELIILLVLLLLLFGAKRLPEIGRSLGRGMREFRDATKGLADDVKSGAEANDKPASEPSKEEPKAGGPAPGQ